MMTQKILKAFLALAVVITCFTGMTTEVKAAKPANVVEKCDGFVKPRNPSDSGAVSTANNINSQRRQKYQQIASKEGVSVQDVASRTGRRLCGG